MKRITFSLFGIIVFGLILVISTISCSKESKLTPEDNFNTSISSRNNVNAAEIHISCVGNCEDNGASGAIWRVPSGTVECNCPKCKMSVDVSNDSNRNTSSRADMTKIAAHFVDYIKRTHETENYLITSYKHSFYDLAEFIEILYIVNDDPSETFSLTFLANFDSSDLKVAPNTILVDCHGSCGSNGGQCVEVYNTTTGEVYCKCESDQCKMTIEEVIK
jgi:hypothetical protein